MDGCRGYCAKWNNQREKDNLIQGMTFLLETTDEGYSDQEIWQIFSQKNQMDKVSLSLLVK